MESHRRGMALVLVMGLILVLGAFGLVARTLTQGASREVDVLGSHLRALAVAESAYGAVVARLTAAPWDQRWFRGQPATEFDVPAAGGTYELLVRDVPAPAVPLDPLGAGLEAAVHQAELMVRATFKRSTVTVFWRLTLPADSLDEVSRVVPLVFVFAPEATPLTPAGADPLSQQIEQLVRDRNANRDDLDRLRPRIQDLTDGEQLAQELGLKPPGPVVDRIPGPGGSPMPTPPPPPTGATPPPGVLDPNTGKRITDPTVPNPIPSGLPPDIVAQAEASLARIESHEFVMGMWGPYSAQLYPQYRTAILRMQELLARQPPPIVAEVLSSISELDALNASTLAFWGN